MVDSQLMPNDKEGSQVDSDRAVSQRVEKEVAKVAQQVKAILEEGKTAIPANQKEAGIGRLANLKVAGIGRLANQRAVKEVRVEGNGRRASLMAARASKGVSLPVAKGHATTVKVIQDRVPGGIAIEIEGKVSQINLAIKTNPQQKVVKLQERLSKVEAKALLTRKETKERAMKQVQKVTPLPVIKAGRKIRMGPVLPRSKRSRRRVATVKEMQRRQLN